MSVDYLRKMLDSDIDVKTGPMPAIDRDSIDSRENISKYSEAKQVLEHQDVVPVLEAMNAYDLLNKYDVNSYHNMAIWVTEALEIFTLEAADTAQAININEGFMLRPTIPTDINELTEDLNDFSVEFLVEFSKRQFMDAEEGDEVGPPSMDMPPQSNTWLDKIASKFGLAGLGIKDFLYLYLLNKAKGGKDDTDKFANKFAKTPEPAMAEAMLNSPLPPIMEGWVQSIEAGFKNAYKDEWEEELYSAALERIEIEEGVDDVHGGADKADDVVEPKSAPQASAKVKKDVKQRIKELDKLIKDYKEKDHFVGEVKPAIFNAKDALEFIMDKINDGTMCSYKKAQIHFQKLMSPITNLFPPSIVKFLAHGDDGEENKLKDV